MGTCCSCDNENKEEVYDIYEGHESSSKSLPKARNIVKSDEGVVSIEASTMVSVHSPTATPSLSLNEMLMLIRVQAAVRAFLERRKYRIQKVYSDTTSRYFK